MNAPAAWASCAAAAVRSGATQRVMTGEMFVGIRIDRRCDFFVDVRNRTVLNHELGISCKSRVFLFCSFFSSIVVYARATTRWRRTTIDSLFCLRRSQRGRSQKESDGARKTYSSSLCAVSRGRRTPVQPERAGSLACQGPRARDRFADEFRRQRAFSQGLQGDAASAKRGVWRCRKRE